MLFASNCLFIQISKHYKHRTSDDIYPKRIIYASLNRIKGTSYMRIYCVLEMRIIICIICASMRILTHFMISLTCASNASQECALRKTYPICIRCVSKMRIMVVPFYAHLKTHLKTHLRRIIDAHYAFQMKRFYAVSDAHKCS